MLHRDLRSVVGVLSVLGILVTGIPGSSLTSTAHAGDLTIRFDEIESIVLSQSPRARIIEQAAAAVQAERDDALRWSSPKLAYDHEESESAREWQLTLQKRIDRPFSQSIRAAGWEGRVRSAQLLAEQEMSDLLSESRAGYVDLRLYDSYIDQLDLLGQAVELASAVADSRHREGALSGLEKQLIQRTAFSIDAARRRVRQDFRRRSASWRAEMGIPDGAEIHLVTPVAYEPVVLEEPASYAEGLEARPGNRAQESLSSALSQHAEAARPSKLPGIEIYAGYKSFVSQLDGFAAGVAFDLPVFGRRAGAARQYEARRLMVENERTIDLAQSRQEITSLVESIRDAQPHLALFTDSADQQPRLSETLLFSYREGSITLDALLNAIQIESTALGDYYRGLATYYLNIFELEAATGATIVHFEPGEK
jgi:Outer membrane efflux protein